MTDHTEMQIPRNIMRTATNVATALLYPEVDDDGRAYLTQEHIDIIARAIFAERSRCHDIALAAGRYGVCDMIINTVDK